MLLYALYAMFLSLLPKLPATKIFDFPKSPTNENI
jgi:hypothetical protein